MAKKNAKKTKSQIKWHRHCARQQKKRTASGEVQATIDVKDDDTRHVVLKTSPERQVVIESESADPGAGEEQPGTSSVAGIETEARETSSEADGDDALSIHAETDDDL